MADEFIDLVADEYFHFVHILQPDCFAAIKIRCLANCKYLSVRLAKIRQVWREAEKSKDAWGSFWEVYFTRHIDILMRENLIRH